MAKRYSKFYSNYILSKKYQYTTKGTIWERDWVTIGAQHQIEKGKRPFYGDSGFLFTDNSITDTHKRHNFGKIVGEWTYDDVYSSTPNVNVVKINRKSNDLRDFAYYGSCSELVRSSIMHIITWFPACIILSKRAFVKGGVMFDNQFGIDLVTDNIIDDEIVNINRYMSKAWGNYRLVLTGTSEPVVIEGYNIVKIYHKLVDNHNNPITDENDDVEITYDEYIELSDSEKLKYGPVNECLGIQKIALIKIKDANNAEYAIYAYLCNGNVVYATSDTQILEIRPSIEVIDEYFYNLDGFEETILRRDSLPLYTNTFLKMFETDNGIRYAYRTYTWPVVNDYCIDIESPLYLSFVEELSETAREFDDTWTDNMWRNMTHESIKNYDWTYKREYSSDEVEDFIEGGNRVEKIIRIYGRVFDDLKRYIDGIRFTVDLSYDSFNNMPDAEISDRLEFNGWEIYSTIPSFDPDEDLSTVYLNNDYFIDNELKWFLSLNNNEVTASTTDISFLRRLALSSKYLMQSKGTLKSIDMIMAMFGIGPNEYSIEEKYRTMEIGEGREICSVARYINVETQKIGDLVHYDNPSYFYEDPYEGVPFGEVELYGRRFIIPYYTNGKYHVGEFAFQSDGGWYKKSLDVRNRNDYEETLSYLHVVPNFSALLEVNTYALSINGGDDNIYYVTDVSDYVEYNENVPYGLNHYFYCTNVYNPELPASWEPILKFIIDPDGEFLTQEQYDNLPLYVRNHDKDIVDAYPPEINLPETITNLNIGDYEGLGYAYVCGGEIVRYISEEEYSDGKFGYHTPSKPCDVKPDEYITAYRYKYELHNMPISSDIPFMQDITNMIGLEEVGENLYNSLGYAKNGSIVFEDGSVNESSLYDVLTIPGFWSLTYKPTHTFDIKQLYERLRKVDAYDYVSLKTLYEDPAEKYVQLDNGLYAPIIESDSELWERAMYIDSIISSSIGNNPHTGYGNYDLGEKFYEYMRRPFKYYLDNYNLSDELRDEMESYHYTLSDNYSAIRWGEIKSDIRQPYLVNTGWSETSDTVDDVTVYTYKKENSDTIIDGKVKNIANTYKYVDGYYINIESDERRPDWTVPYTEIVDGDEYVYTKVIMPHIYNALPESEKSKWDEHIEEDVLYRLSYVLKSQYHIRSETKRDDLLRGWYEYDVTNGTESKYTYRKDITQAEYDAMPSTSSIETEPFYDKTIGGENGWQNSVIKLNLFSKYTDELDEIENTETKHYYINNKLIILKLKSDVKGFFKKYFLDVIGKYVMQVIPSTAITVVLFEGDE